MPKFYVAIYKDNTYHLIWSFRKLQPQDICETCVQLTKLSWCQYLWWQIDDRIEYSEWADDKCYVK